MTSVAGSVGAVAAVGASAAHGSRLRAGSGSRCPGAANDGKRVALRDVAVPSERVSERIAVMHVPQGREQQRTLEQASVPGVQLVPQEREQQRTFEQVSSPGVQLVPQERELQRASSNARWILHVRPDFELPQDVGAPARHGPMAPLERASERIEGREAAPTAISGVVRTSSTLV